LPAHCSESLEYGHYRQALDLAASGKMPLEKLITRFSLDDFKHGAKLALSGKASSQFFLSQSEIQDGK